MKSYNIVLLTLLSVVIFGFTVTLKKDHWIQLFNGRNLSGWDSYIGPDADDNGKPITNIPIGLNNDPRHVFSILKENGENIIHVSGENWGGISTQKEYENYHLQLQFKWGQLTWGPKKGKKKDSGLLYHAVGKHGADAHAWMRSHEFQIEEGNCGDYWGVAGGLTDIPVTKKAADYVYDPQGTLTTFSQDSKQGRHCLKGAPDAENPAGQWNTLDLYCHGDTSIHVVNGKVMMVLYHLRQSDNKQELPLAKGKIQIQSEGAEIFYRQIKIQPINHLPPVFLKP